MSEPVVSVRGLSKRFGALEALAGVDLDIRRAEIFALLGPNGAGKTTLISIVAGDMYSLAVRNTAKWSPPVFEPPPGTLPEWRSASDLFDDDIRARITPARSVGAKTTPQSTAPAAVAARLQDVREWVAAATSA